MCSSWNNRGIKIYLLLNYEICNKVQFYTYLLLIFDYIWFWLLPLSFHDFCVTIISIFLELLLYSFFFFLAKEPQCILPFHPIKSEKVPAASGIPKMPVPCKNLQFCRQILWILPEVTLQEQIHLKETRHQCEKLIFTKTDTTCLLFCFLRFNSENKLVLW